MPRSPRPPRPWLIRKNRYGSTGRPWELWKLIGGEYRRVACRSRWEHCVQVMQRIGEAR